MRSACNTCPTLVPAGAKASSSVTAAEAEPAAAAGRAIETGGAAARALARGMCRASATADPPGGEPGHRGYVTPITCRPTGHAWPYGRREASIHWGPEGPGGYNQPRSVAVSTACARSLAPIFL